MNGSSKNSAEGDFLQAALGRLRTALTEDLKGLARLRPGQTVPSNPLATLVQTVNAESKTFVEARQSGNQLRQQQVQLRSEALSAAPVQMAETLKNRVANRKEEIVVPVENAFVLAGRVLDSASGNGLANVRVVVRERDPQNDDRLGETRTDSLGYYRFEYRGEEFHEPMDKQPETYIQIEDDAGNVVYHSDRSFRHVAGKVEILDAAIDGTKVPDARKEGEQNEVRVQTNIRELEQEAKVAAQRKVIYSADPFGRIRAAPAPRKTTRKTASKKSKR